MALGRGSAPDQVTLGQGRSLSTGTSIADRQPELVRDADADRRKAIEDMIAAYEAEGKDTSHLRKSLGRKGRKVGSYHTAVVSAEGNTVPEPEDGSAPDKREQDQSPQDDQVGSPVDPGPEAGSELPVQPQVATTPPEPEPVVQEPQRTPAAAPAKKAAPRKAPAKRAPAKRTPRARTR